MVLSWFCYFDDQFIISILWYWCMKYDELLVEYIKFLFIKNNSLFCKRQSLRSFSSKLVQLILEQILEYLDNLWFNLINIKQNFFSQILIFQVLQYVQVSCDEVYKMKFSDFFFLVEEYEDFFIKLFKSW